MKKYIIKAFAVSTEGGQIVTYQRPEQIDIICQSAAEKRQVIQRANRFGGLISWDNTANYYLTEAAALHAIGWALSN